MCPATFLVNKLFVAFRKLDSVEVYDVEQGRWRYLARMPGGARLGSAVSVHERCLYVIGGYTGEVDKPILDDVLCFDLQKEKYVLSLYFATGFFLTTCFTDWLTAIDFFFNYSGILEK